MYDIVIIYSAYIQTMFLTTYNLYFSSFYSCIITLLKQFTPFLFIYAI